jgi:hypothetical protein
MIVHTVDHGWGPEWPIKQIEQRIVNDYLRPLITDSSRTVIINSTWYGEQQHHSTMQWLRSHAWDNIVLVAMIDAAIPQPRWFQEFNRPVLAVGNYAGDHDIAFWAQVLDQHFVLPDVHGDIDTAFMCLNRKPHWHRVRLYDKMEAQGLLDHGIVSMGSEGESPARRVIAESVIPNTLAPNGHVTQHGIINDIVTLGDPVNWRRCVLNVVTETVFDVSESNFVSEKIFKPMLGDRPFLVYATDGAVSWLDQHGFQDYTKDFGDITDLDLSGPENMIPFLKVLVTQPRSYFQHKIIDLQDKIAYNYHRFREFVQEQQIKIQKGIACQI